MPSLTLKMFGCAAFGLSCIIAAPTITINPATTHQTITGWGISEYYALDDPALFPTPPAAATVNQIFDRAVNEFGVNRIRLGVRSGSENQDYYAQYKAGTLPYQEWRCRRYSTSNDNNDPNVLNMAGFHFSDMDERIGKLVIPLRQKLQAKGEQLYIALNYVAFVDQISAAGCPAGLQYHHDDSPQEYAEFILAVFTHMRNKYGFVPDAVEVVLEPDNTAFWRAKQIGDAIVATGQKLAANGFTPKFIGPSTTNMTNAMLYFDDLARQVPAALPYLSELSYHRYGGVSDSALQGIAARAQAHNLQTSMLEWISTGNSFQILHKDLKMGRNSAWQQGDIAVNTGSTSVHNAFLVVDPSNTTNIGPSPMSRYTRHYFEFVRRGAVRVDAQSSSSSHDPLAFRNTNGKYVVVMIANASGAFDINGLPAGTYGVKYTSLSNNSLHNISGSDVTIGPGQTLTASIPYAAVVTVYARNGSVSYSDCDMDNNGSINLADVQSAVDQSLAVAPCTKADLDRNGNCNVVDIQRVVISALGGACRVN
jgi:O-glycosyl hydrolase